MTGKKSFVLYTESIEIFEALSDEDAGQLIKHIFRYVNDQNPETNNEIVKLMFISIKQYLKRDLVKWRQTSEIRSEIGKKGGIASGKKRKQKKANEAIGLNGKQNEANASKRTDSVSDSVSDNERLKDNIDFKFFWDAYDKKIDRPKCEKKWNKLPEETQLKILSHIEIYKKATPDKQYRKNPLTYLNNESWENEIIEGAKDGIYAKHITEDKLRQIAADIEDEFR